MFIFITKKETEYLYKSFCLKDIVDILIGWYIEPLPTDRILEYTSQALHKFRPFWIEQIEILITLLEHLIEDADNYTQVNFCFLSIEIDNSLFFSNSNNKKKDNDENIISYTDKVAALYR